MRFLRTRWSVGLALLVLLGAPGAWLLAKTSAKDDPTLIARVKRGPFAVTINTAGELRARKFVEITAPANAQQAEAYQMKIASIVPEGTVVKVGDVVAELDRSTLASKLQEVSLALTKAQAVYEQATLDSTLNLSKAREDIRTMELGLEEKKLAKEQAIYEAPTIKRQAEIDYEKATRALAQAKSDYKTKTEQAKAKMREVGADLDRQKNRLAVVQQVMGGFTIRAPAPGMVIYIKDWNGKKLTTGSQVNAWNPGVATLPDLTQMESITYVNEIDVRKIAVGQPVAITLDADPTKKLPGVVPQVANVGEQRPNSDSKVFEVHVTLTKADTTLRPGMTTGNAIETFRVKDALHVPIEAVSNENGIAYVFRRDGASVVKQQVAVGAMNDDAIIVQQGLAEGDRVLLTPPLDKDKIALVKLRGLTDKKTTVGGDTAARVKLQAPVPGQKKD